MATRKVNEAPAVAVEDGPAKYNAPTFTPGKPTPREILRALAEAPPSLRRVKEHNERLVIQRKAISDQYITPHADRSGRIRGYTDDTGTAEAQAALAAIDRDEWQFDPAARRDRVVDLFNHNARIKDELKGVRRAITPLMTLLRRNALDPQSYLQLKWLRGIENDTRICSERLDSISLELGSGELVPDGYMDRLGLIRQGIEAARVLCSDKYGRSNAGTARALLAKLEPIAEKMTAAIKTHTWAGLEKLRDQPIGD